MKFQYYRFIVRIRRKLNPEKLKGLRRVIWNYLSDIPITDIHVAKINKPSGVKFLEVEKL